MRDEIIRTTRFVSRKRARLIQCEFHIREQVSKGEEGRKNVRGTAGTPAKGLSLSPSSRFFIPSFLPSFLPRCDMRPRGVYFLWLLHAHSIILYSFSPPYTADLSYFPSSLHIPDIPCLCHITRRACKFNFPARPHNSPRSPSLSPSSPPPPPPPSISACLKSKLLEIGSGRHRSPPIPQGNT